ncbi:class A beta-lactamase-related serine hydrolase [Bacillus infantis]|uniref:class A beta-lactamase-related serine hydrolase n=1 Tax=Bacillus infantis TaxID=324767 RepID=UPI002155A7CE|nr:class A beta-lactamase-related serine hydrolase [Bacillus infantis]MCR6611237.1 class A beta-lactamase-related serine hydrolase [Bacillus infantis]
MKIFLWIGGAVFLAACIVIAIGAWLYIKDVKKDEPDYLIKFIKENNDKKDVSLLISHNKEILAKIHPDEALPLASTVKFIVAVEYAKQAAAGKINPEQQVSLKELERYYVPKTDGGGHKAWLSELKANSASLQQVAKGMIAYSSNANTDYLIELLGLHKINSNLESLNLENHEPLYPLASSLFIPIKLMEENNLSKKEALAKLKVMPLREYRDMAIDIHSSWQSDPPTSEEKAQLLKKLDMDFQQVWSDRLPRSTAADYASLMEKLNSKSYLAEDIHTYLDPVLEQLMEDSRNQEWLLHAGQKGGSTAFVLTMAMYATDTDNNQTEIAFLSNNLSPKEQAKLTRNMNSFQLKLLKDEKFREKVRQELKNLN